MALQTAPLQIVQEANGFQDNTSGNTLAVSFPTPVHPGNTVLAIFNGQTQNGFTSQTQLSDNQGNTYVADGKNGNIQTPYLSLFRCSNVAASGTFTITAKVTLPANAAISLYIMEVAGLALNPVDQIGYNGNGGFTSIYTHNNLITSNYYELVIATAGLNFHSGGVAWTDNASGTVPSNYANRFEMNGSATTLPMSVMAMVAGAPGTYQEFWNLSFAIFGYTTIIASYTGTGLFRPPFVTTGIQAGQFDDLIVASTSSPLPIALGAQPKTSFHVWAPNAVAVPQLDDHLAVQASTLPAATLGAQPKTAFHVWAPSPAIVPQLDDASAIAAGWPVPFMPMAPQKVLAISRPPIQLAQLDDILAVNESSLPPSILGAMAKTAFHVWAPSIVNVVPWSLYIEGWEPFITIGSGPKISPPLAIAQYLTVPHFIDNVLYKYNFPFNNLQANTNPTVHNDASQNYAPGSLWINKTSQVPYICVRATVNAAVWISAVGSTGPAGAGNVADQAPTSPGTYDQEFNGTADTLPTGWSWVTTPSGSDSWTLNSTWPSMIVVQGTGGAGYNLKLSSFSPAGAFGIWMKGYLGPYRSGSDNPDLTLQLADASDHNYRIVQVFGSGQEAPQLRFYRGSGGTAQTWAGGAGVVGVNLPIHTTMIYLGISNDGSGNWRGWYSSNGVAWTEWGSFNNQAITLDHLYIQFRTTTEQSLSAVDWVRSTSGGFPNPS